MIVLDSQKVCFICAPKNGTHTLYGHLGKFGGRRIGMYHESDKRLIPRSKLSFKRYKTYLVWREPVERAVSLYKDIVVREQEKQRVVKHPDSILRHQMIASLCPDFSKFVDFLTYSNKFNDDYLFKNQTWWNAMVEPTSIVPLADLNELVADLTGQVPQKLHSTESLKTQVVPDEDAIQKIRLNWALNDYALLDPN
ncbi:sulfotransferase family 2 domain-containing protein [uncultured Paraglaciecola sp.]|uniref:sulfotransferase family 2 domain-containing protein n=1 Tax=uncultured Paraglaciecola sp. TaxID=1765024 RepID=UPI002604C23B|nr:sulfotransferase family 2 domain-containing protein [uncultured Paraglaciecola sp.]